MGASDLLLALRRIFPSSSMNSTSALESMRYFFLSRLRLTGPRCSRTDRRAGNPCRAPGERRQVRGAQHFSAGGAGNVSLARAGGWIGRASPEARRAASGAAPLSSPRSGRIAK